MLCTLAVRLRATVSRAVLLGLVSSLPLSMASAQTRSGVMAALQPVKQADRIAANPDLGPLTRLSAQLPAWVKSRNQTSERTVDLGATIQISLVLNRDAAAQTALELTLANQQNPNSAIYHQWLTPQQIGQLYGPTQNDLAVVSAWLTSQGLKVSVAPSGVIVEASGTLAVVGNAFHTSFGSFNVRGTSRLSTVSEPSIPSALTPLIRSIHGLTETHYEPQSKMSLQELPAKGLKPQVSLGGGVNGILPNDFAVIYDIASVYSGGNTGAMIGSKAQHIAIIGESRVVAADITNYEILAGLSTSIQPNVVLAGPDPGVVAGSNSPASEATLDLDRVIGTAPGAQADLVISGNSATSDGLDIAIAYNINTLKDPVMTISFGGCEADNGSAETDFLNTEFEMAAGEGISTFVSSDDSGVAGCDTAFTPVTSQEEPQVASINVLCSSGYVTCVGGTEFNDTADPSLYWSSTNSGSGNESALKYIPEGAWNEPSTTSTSGVITYAPAASGGGVSAYIAKPSYQAGIGVPADGFRDVPDVAFSASDHDGYIACFAAGGGSCVAATPGGGISIEIFSGTSAAAPGMAGIAALLNTKLGSAQGNMNPILYGLAATNPTVFHDVTVASSGVSGCTTATPSMCNNSTPGPTSLTGGLAGYEVTAGYDQSTGLGSIDVATLLADATGGVTPPPTLVSTSLALTAAANPITAGQSTTFTATLTPASSTAGTPTGTVQFYSNGTAFGSAITLSSDVATSASEAFPTAATYAITAVYSGDATFATSAATALSLVVNAASSGSFTLAASPTTLTAAVPALNATTTSTSVITGTSGSGFAGPVALTCAVTPATGVPPTCVVSPTSITLAASGTATSTLTVTTTGGTGCVASAAVTKPQWLRESSGIALAGLLLLLLPSRKRRALRALAMVCLLAAGFGLMSGCGGSSSMSSACNTVVSAPTTTGTYTVTVTGTSGSLTATTPVTVKVN
jgi:pseudomonalisin